MKKLIFILSILFLSTGLFHTEAQVGNYLKKKTSQAGNRAAKKSDEEVTGEMNKKVDVEIGKAFNKLFGEEEEEEETKTTEPSTTDSNEGSSNTNTQKKSTPPSGSESSSSDARANAMLKAMGISTDPVDVQENYNYSGNIIMTVQSWDDDGDTEGEALYKTYMTKDNSGFAMVFSQEEEGKSTMIFDYKKESMLILSDDGETKSGMVTAYSGLADQMSEAEEDLKEDIESDDTDYSAYREGLKKTGKSKKIAGYKCDEYIFDDEKSHIVMWMTDQLSADLWANMSGANVISAGSMGFYGGFVMEMDQKDKNSKDRVYTLVKEVNKNQASSLSTKGYQLMSIGGMPQ